MTSSVLWVTTERPAHDGGGGSQRQARLLVALARHLPVDLLALGPVDDHRVLDAVRRLHVVERPVVRPESRPVRRARAAATAWLRRTPLDVAAASRDRAALLPTLAQMAPTASAVLLHHQVLGPLLARPRPPSSARWALSLFHAAAERSAQEAEVEANRLQRALLRQESANAARAERRFVDRADVLVVATAADGELLSRPGTPTHVVPQGVERRHADLAPLASEPVVLFSGSLDYSPNVDAAVWLVEEVWGHVRAEVPAARLLLVGRHPAGEVRALAARPGVEVHADVPSMAPWLAMARVSVAPLRIGTGVRVKAMEALAAGLPLVATTRGVEGVPVSSEAAAVEDEPVLFARAVVGLLTDDGLAAARRRAGVQLVERMPSWDDAGAELARALC